LYSENGIAGVTSETHHVIDRFSAFSVTVGTDLEKVIQFIDLGSPLPDI
jgi:hypothetical protein